MEHGVTSYWMRYKQCGAVTHEMSDNSPAGAAFTSATAGSGLAAERALRLTDPAAAGAGTGVAAEEEATR